MSERQIALKCMSSVQRDINKHLDRIAELQREGRYFMAWLRDTQLTGEEMVAAMEARMWWEQRERAA